MMKNQQEIAAPNISAHTGRLMEIKLERGTTRWVTYAAAFTALAVVMKFIGQFLTITPAFKITFIYVVWLISGAVLGGFGGGAVCFASDVLGALIFPTGPINPFLIVGNTLYGVVAAAIVRCTPAKSYAVRIAVAGLFCTVINTCVINTLAIYYSYDYAKVMNVWQYFVAYRILQPVVAIINIVVAIALVPLLTRLRLLPREKRNYISEGE